MASTDSAGGPAHMQGTSPDFAARARPADAVPRQTDVYATLQQDGSPLARQGLQLIDSLDGLGMLTSRLSARLGPVAWRIFALLFLPFVLLPLFERASWARRVAPDFVTGLAVVVELLIFVSLIHVILTAVTFKARFDKGRLLVFRGILRRTESGNELCKIEDIRICQTMLNHVTGDGCIILSVAGEDGGVRTVNLAGVAGINQLRRIADQLRNVVLLLRAGQF